jgi:hypothetical protein
MSFLVPSAECAVKCALYNFIIFLQWNFCKLNFKGNKKIFKVQKYIFLAYLSVEFTSGLCPLARKTW